MEDIIEEILKKIIDKIGNIEWHKLLLYIVILFLLFLCVRNCTTKQIIQTKIVTRSDTVCVTETVFVEKPIPIEKVVLKTIIDTVYYENEPIQAEIPITQVTYKDSLYKAIISGYKPCLESIEIYCPQTTITTNTEQITTIQKADYSKNSIGLNIGASAAVIDGNVRIVPTVSVGWNIDLLRWRKRN